jgi:outer membrane protein TolC
MNTRINLIIILMIALSSLQAADWTLERCIETALENHPTLKIKETESRMADEQWRQARAARLPAIELQANARYQSTVPELSIPPVSISPDGQTSIPVFQGLSRSLGSHDQEDIQLNVTQPVFTGFQLVNRQKAARAVQDAQQVERQGAQLSLHYQVIEAYGITLQAHKRIDVAETTVAQIQSHLEDIRNMAQQGMARHDQVLQVSVRLSRAKVALQEAQNRFALARTSLEYLIGTTLPSTWQPTEPESFAVGISGLEDAIQTGYNARSEISSLKYLRQAAEFNRRIATGSRYPSIQVFGRYGYGKPGLDFVDNDWMDYWVVGIGMQWDVYQWGKRDSRIQQAEWEKRRVSYRLEALQRSIRMDITSSWLTLGNSRDRLQMLQEVVEQAQQSYEVVRNMYQQGMARNSEVLDAQSEWSRASIQLAVAETDLLIATADLLRAMGTLESESR